MKNSEDGIYKSPIFFYIMNMNDFVKRHWDGNGGRRMYEPPEPIEIECDLYSGTRPFHCDCRFKLGLVTLGGIVYNEHASDHCVKMSYLCHRFRINGNEYDLRQYHDNEEAFDPFVAMVEENITPQEVIDVEDIVL